MQYLNTRNPALVVLFGLLLAKQVAIEVWGKDSYREGFLIVCSAALALILVFGALCVWSDWRKSKND
ncbi:MAG: hypothetical protein AAFW87_05760 [Pseudomonadota bacterium]